MQQGHMDFVGFVMLTQILYQTPAEEINKEVQHCIAVSRCSLLRHFFEGDQEFISGWWMHSVSRHCYFSYWALDLIQTWRYKRMDEQVIWRTVPEVDVVEGLEYSPQRKWHSGHSQFPGPTGQVSLRAAPLSPDGHAQAELRKKKQAIVCIMTTLRVLYHIKINSISTQLDRWRIKDGYQ